MAKKSRRRKRSTSEKVMIVLGILIAISMLLSLIVGLGSGGSNSQAPLPENERFEPNLEGISEPIGSNEAGFARPVAGIPVGALAPPTS